MKTALKTVCSAALLFCMGCTDTTGFSIGSDTPSSLSATKGRGDGLKLSWSAPGSSDSPEDRETIAGYTIERDGLSVGNSSGTSWVDPTAVPATEYTYVVTANFFGGGSSGPSNKEEGWYVPANDLSLATGPGLTSSPGSYVTADGWYETVVVKGWTYHFNTQGPAAQLWICNGQSPWEQQPLGSSAAFTWVADRTGDVWIRTASAQDLEAWYE